MQSIRIGTRFKWHIAAIAGAAAMLTMASTAVAVASSPVSSPSSTSSASRTITVTGYAWCLSSMGISIPVPVVCESVTLDTGDGYHQTVSPHPGLIGPLDSGRFTFTDVPIRDGLSEMTYTVTAEMGSGLTDAKPLRCVHEGTIQGAFFQGNELDLFWAGGPWTALPFSQCSTSA
jgi:hypothetical protein